MKTHIIYECDVCGNASEDKSQIEKCENQINPETNFKIGDSICFQLDEYPWKNKYVKLNIKDIYLVGYYGNHKICLELEKEFYRYHTTDSDYTDRLILDESVLIIDETNKNSLRHSNDDLTRD